jgi:hypothetical protein
MCTLCTDSLDREDGRRHGEQHLEAGLPRGGAQVQQVGNLNQFFTYILRYYAETETATEFYECFENQRIGFCESLEVIRMSF